MAAKYIDTITDLAGNALAGATVQLLDQNGALVTLFADTGLSTPIGSSASANDNGLVQFYVPNGTYTIRQTYAGASITISDVQLFDLSEFIGQLASPAGPGLVGFSHSDAYPGGTVGNHLKRFAVVTDAPWNAKGNDLDDDTTAINAAIAFVQANGGGDVLIPKGVFRVTSLDVPIGPNYSVNIVGQGYFSVIKTISATADVIHLGAWWSSVRNLRIVSAVTRTAGKYIDIDGHWCTVSEVAFYGDYIGIHAKGVGTQILDNKFYEGAGGARRIWLSGGDTSMIVERNVLAYQTSPSVDSGIYVDDNIAAIIQSNHIIGQGRCLNICPSDGQSVAFSKVIGNYFDTATIGVNIEPSGTGIVSCIEIESNWSANQAAIGYLFSSLACTTGQIDGVSVIDTKSVNNANAGIALLGNKTLGVVIDGGCIRGKPSGGSSSITPTGISVGDDVSGFAIRNVSLKDGDGYLGNYVGIFLGANTDEYSIIGNDLRGQISKTIENGATYSTTKRIAHNLGFITDSSGSGQIATGQTSATINHGCSVAPRPQDIRVQQTVSPTIANNVVTLDTTSITDTQFTVRCAGAAAGNLSFTYKISGGDL